MERLRQDMAFGVRLLLRQPGFTLVAVLTLALGIGVSVVMASFAGAILHPSLPYKDPDRLVVVERWRVAAESDLIPFVSLPALTDWKTRNHVFSDLSILISDSRSLTGGEGDPESINNLLVSANLLPTLGIEPVLGRGFTEDDDQRGAPRTVVVSHELWQRRLGGDDKVLGQTLHLDDLAYTVIGVLPEGLATEKLGNAPLGALWLPVGLFAHEMGVDDRKRATDWVTVCRLKPGVGVAGASEDMARITRELAEEYPETDKEKRTLVVPLREHLVGDFRPMVLAFAAAVAIVLLIACANLVNLTLTRFVVRQQEFAIRAALGAGRRRMVGQVLTETLVLALAGGLVGLIAASILIRALPAVLANVPHADQAWLSPGTLAFTVLLVLLLTLVVGLVPALQTLSPSWQPLLTGSLGSRAFPVHRRLRQALVVGEIALAFVLLTGTGLIFATFLNLRGQDLGFLTGDLLTIEVALPASKYGEVAEWTSFYDQALARMSAQPGAEAATLVNTLPMGENHRASSVFAGGRPVPPVGKRSATKYYIVSPGFFRAMGIPLHEGRGFTPRDDDRREASRGVVISQSLARHFWPGESALGREVGFEIIGGDMANPLVAFREVVGIVGDTRYLDVRNPPEHAVYVPYTQRPTWEKGRSPRMALILKTSIEPADLAAVARSELLEIDSNQPLGRIRTVQGIVDQELERPRTTFVLLTLFTGLALFLAVVGIYGVVSYMVAARTREIGVRMALGARPSQVLVRLLSENLTLILVGLAVGLALAASLTRLITRVLHGVHPMDPTILLGGCVILTVAALLATSVPASQAARIDPARSLRHE